MKPSGRPSRGPSIGRSRSDQHAIRQSLARRQDHRFFPDEDGDGATDLVVPGDDDATEVVAEVLMKRTASQGQPAKVSSDRNTKSTNSSNVQSSTETAIIRPALKTTKRRSILSRGQRLFKTKPKSSQRRLQTKKKKSRKLGNDQSGHLPNSTAAAAQRESHFSHDDTLPVNNAKWSKPQPPPSTMSEQQKLGRRCQSVGKGGHSKTKGFSFDDDEPDPNPPRKPTRARSSPMYYRRSRSLQISSPRKGMGSSRTCGQFDDATENSFEEQFEDAIEAHSTEGKSYRPFVNNSDHISVKSGQQYSQYDDASPRALPPKTIQTESFLAETCTPSNNSRRGKTPMSTAKASLLRNALTRVRSMTVDRKSAQPDSRSGDSSFGVSIGALSPFRKKDHNAFSQSPANGQYSGSSSIRKDKSELEISRTRSEKSRTAIEGTVSNAETEKAQNLPLKKTRSENTTIKTHYREPRIQRRAVKKDEDGLVHQKFSMKSTYSNKNNARISSSSSSRCSVEEDERRTENNNANSRSTGSEKRQTNDADLSSMPDRTTSNQISTIAKSNRIRLHVYDLVSREIQLDLFGCHFPLGQCFNTVNNSLHSMGTGAYHVGIEVNGVEYAYGANSTRGLTGKSVLSRFFICDHLFNVLIETHRVCLCRNFRCFHVRAKKIARLSIQDNNRLWQHINSVSVILESAC